MKCLCRGAGFLMFYTFNGFSAASNVEEDVLEKFRDFFFFYFWRKSAFFPVLLAY